MNKIEWNERYETGIVAIDDQHRKVISLINRLLDLSGVTTNGALVEDTLNEMTKYVMAHLEAEEALLAEWGYPKIEEHIATHDEFRKATAMLCYEVVKGRVKVPEELLGFLCHWWTTHILRDDMDYVPFAEVTCGSDSPRQ